MILLSICIPVYNRKDFIRDAVESVLNQLNNDTREYVEVVISDNASNDGTDKVVNEIIAQYKDFQIVYSRANENYGPDRNYLRVVEMAQGKYCWFLGSDDRLVSGSIDRILEEINNKHSIYLFPRYNCQLHTKKVLGQQSFWVDGLKRDQVFVFENVADWCFYFGNCVSIGGIFSYLSSIVFQRDKWNLVDGCDEYIGSAYVHVAKLIQVLLIPGSSLKYLHSGLVYNTTGNDSFFTTAYNRIMLDFDGYMNLEKLLPDNDIVRSYFRRVLREEHSSLSMELVLKCSSKEFKVLMKTMKKLEYKQGALDTYCSYRKIRFVLAIVFDAKRIAGKILRKMHIIK